MKNNLLCTVQIFILLTATMLVGCSSKEASDQNISATENSKPDSTVEITDEIDEINTDTPVDSTLSDISSWNIILNSKIAHPTNVVGFLNESFAITVGYGGEIHYSLDGGNTWPESENSSMCRLSLDIIDENLAWCGGNGNNVRVTKDGGKTWTAVSDINLDNVHSYIDFVDDSTGWVATLKKCSKTIDGGATWSPLTLPEEVKSIAAISLRTSEAGYLLTHDGLLFTTSDGGSTWNKFDLEFAKYEIKDTKSQVGLNKMNLAIADISFYDENNGIVVFIGMVPGEGFHTYCLATSDGGNAWTDEILDQVEDFIPARVFLSDDGKYLTLCSNSQQIVVLASNESTD